MVDTRTKFALIGIVGLIIGSVFLNTPPQEVIDIQGGKVILVCHLESGLTQIDKTKIVDIDNDPQRWIFTNGSADMDNCISYDSTTIKG